MQDLYQVRLAQIYLTLEQREEAKKHLAMALVLNPHNEEALALESTLAFQNDQPNKAAKLIDQALNINPTNPSLLKEKADQAAAKGDYDTASKLYEQVTTLEPDNWMVRDAFLDALLGKNPIYHWLVLKSNFLKRQPIFLVSCLVDIAVVILSFFLLGFFHDYPFLKVGPLILVVVYLVVRLCAWGTRLVSHTILSRKLWKLKLVDHLNFPNFLSMHMILMIVGYLLSLVWQVDLGMSIALSTICLLWISSLTFLIKDQTIRKILTYYVVCLYGLGALNLLLSILDIPASSFFSKVLFIGIFLGIVLAGFGTVKYSKES